MKGFFLKTKIYFISAGIIASILACAPAAAQTLFPAFNEGPNVQTLVVYSSLDEDASKPLIAAFQEQNPSVAILYEDLQSLDIYERVIRETDNGEKTADLVLSSAMDLQVKLVNDGYAQTSFNANTDNWPSWAKWRNSAFGLTYEPSVLVYHKPSFKKISPPKNRSDLVALLKNNDDEFYGKIATYDIERSGFGFLILARDQEHNRNIWDLVSAMGSTGVKLYSNSSSILERVSDGRFVLGYNIVGSYAENWVRQNPDLGIIMLEDYTIVMSRIALIPQAAANAELGKTLLSFLMSKDGQAVMASDVKLPALHPDVFGSNTASTLRDRMGSQLRPISIGPGLIAYLDQVKRSRFISQWNTALRGN